MLRLINKVGNEAMQPHQTIQWVWEEGRIEQKFQTLLHVRRVHCVYVSKHM